MSRKQTRSQPKSTHWTELSGNVVSRYYIASTEIYYFRCLLGKNMLLSVDGGATKTLAAIYDGTSNNIVGSGVSGSSNYAEVGAENAGGSLRAAINGALDMALVDEKQIDHAIFSIASVGDSIEYTEIGKKIVSEAYGGRNYTLINDGMAAYRMANLDFDGVIFAPGTGSVGFMKKGNEFKRIGGWGPLFGDEASAYWIGRKFLTYATRAQDGLDGYDKSLPLSIEEIFNTDFREAVTKLTRERKKREIASLAVHVTRLAKEGSETCNRILNEAAGYISEFITSTYNIFGDRIKYSLVGGTMLSGKFYVDRIVKQTKPKVRVYYGYQVAIGGIIELLERKGIKTTEEDRDVLLNGLNRAVSQIDSNTLLSNLLFEKPVEPLSV